jgi:hypothetical protein
LGALVGGDSLVYRKYQVIVSRLCCNDDASTVGLIQHKDTVALLVSLLARKL